ncbi:MAG TPA: hypothetical protein PLT82_07470 [Candidatus Hydrogenedens sp.]|nr:hypothetical protein [Candidatus Hydrogenedens sp.]HOL18993.1 hypothetical protein [Candidatus Hydrogenedens sp.]HPP58955.1 hypothetical protein [Candidatus Hydrogenedens sp.]
MKHLIYYSLVLLVLALPLLNISCNAYFESKKKVDDKMLSEEERDVLMKHSPSNVDNTNLKKNIGDIENDLHFLLCIPSSKVPSNANIQKEEGSHGKVSRMEVKITSPYPKEMFVELSILPRGTIDYKKYPVRVDGKIIRDGETINEFKTVITALESKAIPVPMDNMYPLRFEVKLWDTEPEGDSTMLLYAQAKLSLYSPEIDPNTIYQDKGDLKPIEETEVLSNPLRITLMKGK